MTAIEPTLGMGVTYGIGSDRYPYTIIKIVSSRKIVIQADRAIRIDKNGLPGPQVYEYHQDSNAATRTLTLRKNGRWVLEGDPIKSSGCYTLGQRQAYTDPSF